VECLCWVEESLEQVAALELVVAASEVGNIEEQEQQIQGLATNMVNGC